MPCLYEFTKSNRALYIMRRFLGEGGGTSANRFDEQPISREQWFRIWVASAGEKLI